MGTPSHVDGLGETALTMNGSVKTDLMGKWLAVQSMTRGRLKATYAEPVFLASAGTVASEKYLPINRKSNASISFDIDFGANGVPRVTTKYVLGSLSVSTSTDLTILYGERLRLQELARQLPMQTMDPVWPSSIVTLPCAAFVWSSERNGIGSAIIMIDDQLSALERLALSRSRSEEPWASVEK